MVIRCELVLLSYPGASEVAIVKESWYRKVGGKGRRGISFAWRQHRFFFIDFSLLLALSYDKPEETGKGGGGEGGEGGGGGGVRARGWREAHRVRFTPALLLCSLPDLHLWNVQGTFSQMLYISISA